MVEIGYVGQSKEGEYAVADHPHAESWGTPDATKAPVRAANQVQIDQHGGPAADWDSRTNWGFLDGHAETLKFKEVYRTSANNNFDPDHTAHE